MRGTLRTWTILFKATGVLSVYRWFWGKVYHCSHKHSSQLHIPYYYFVIRAQMVLKNSLVMIANTLFSHAQLTHLANILLSHAQVTYIPKTLLSHAQLTHLHQKQSTGLRKEKKTHWRIEGKHHAPTPKSPNAQSTCRTRGYRYFCTMSCMLRVLQPKHNKCRCIPCSLIMSMSHHTLWGSCSNWDLAQLSVELAIQSAFCEGKKWR